MAEWAALEMRYARNGIGGSNPPASALGTIQVEEKFSREFSPPLYYKNLIRRDPAIGGGNLTSSAAG